MRGVVPMESQRRMAAAVQQQPLRSGDLLLTVQIQVAPTVQIQAALAVPCAMLSAPRCCWSSLCHSLQDLNFEHPGYAR